MPVTTLYLCIVARLDDLVDGHGDAELDESNAGVVGTRFLDQDQQLTLDREFREILVHIFWF